MRAGTSAPAANGPNCGSVVPKRTASVQMIQRRRVPARDQRPLVRGHVAEMFLERLARLRPGAVAVRIVRRPHDVSETRPMPRGDAGEVLDERRMALAVPVRARLLR